MVVDERSAENRTSEPILKATLVLRTTRNALEGITTIVTLNLVALNAYYRKSDTFTKRRGMQKSSAGRIFCRCLSATVLRNAVLTAVLIVEKLSTMLI